MSIVRLKDVYFSYEKDSPVLEGIDLCLSRGNISVLMGPSGSGKTTLLRIVNLLENPSSGKVIHGFKGISKEEKTDLLSLRRRMGFVFQEPALFDSSVEVNVAYGIMARSGFLNHFWGKAKKIVPFLKSNHDEVKGKVSSALERVGLEGLQDRSIRSLSAGEHRRVSLARSLVIEPEMLLLDEPTGNLDPRNTAIVEEIIREIRSQATTIFLASHDMHQAERIGERVYLLLDGDIVEGGSAEKIFNSPEDQRTKDFITGKLVC
ncbi:MAG: ATP-binding cassette domain-containing protein [Candidatus Bipolaricaulia bacterium]